MYTLFVAIAEARRAPRHHSLWMCIHHQEGAWDDDGAPYYGGLQMSWWFMRTYGKNLLRIKGTADRWTPLEQMTVAQNAYQREGFSRRWLYHQWPKSAPPCSHHAV